MEDMHPMGVDGQRDDLSRLEGSLFGGAHREGPLAEMGVDILLRAHIADHLHLSL